MRYPELSKSHNVNLRKSPCMCTQQMDPRIDYKVFNKNKVFESPTNYILCVSLTIIC